MSRLPASILHREGAQKPRKFSQVNWHIQTIVFPQPMIKTVTVHGVKKYRVVSHKTGKNMGTYPHTKAGHKKAEKRLRQVKFFGSKK